MVISDASVERTWKVKTKGIDEIELEEMSIHFREIGRYSAWRQDREKSMGRSDRRATLEIDYG